MSKKTTKVKAKAKPEQWVRINACPASVLDFVKHMGHEVFSAAGTKGGQVLAKDSNDNAVWVQADGGVDILVSEKPVYPVVKANVYYNVTKGTSESKFVVKVSNDKDGEYWHAVMKQLGYFTYQVDGHTFAQFGLKLAKSIIVTVSYTTGKE